MLTAEAEMLKFSIPQRPDELEKEGDEGELRFSSSEIGSWEDVGEERAKEACQEAMYALNDDPLQVGEQACFDNLYIATRWEPMLNQHPGACSVSFGPAEPTLLNCAGCWSWCPPLSAPACWSACAPTSWKCPAQ